MAEKIYIICGGDRELFIRVQKILFAKGIAWNSTTSKDTALRKLDDTTALVVREKRIMRTEYPIARVKSENPNAAFIYPYPEGVKHE